MRGILALAALALAAMAPTYVQAAPLPPAVAAMIVEVAKSDDTLGPVVKVAKATNPESADEIDALRDSLKARAAAEKEAKLAEAGFFDAWSGSGQIGVSKTTGNTDDTGFIVGLDLKKDGLKFRHKFRAQVDRQKSAGLVTRDRYLAGYQLDYKFNDRLYAFGKVDWDRDTFAGFSRRLSEAFGVGYSVFKGPRVTLDVNGGPAFRQTRFITGLTEKTTTARAGLDASWKILDKLTLSERAEAYFTGAFNSTTALTGAISSKLSARASFDVIHESDPPFGRVSTDTVTRFSLVYGF